MSLGIGFAEGEGMMKKVLNICILSAGLFLIVSPSYSYSEYTEPPTVIDKIKATILGEEEVQCINPLQNGMPLFDIFQNVERC